MSRVLHLTAAIPLRDCEPVYAQLGPHPLGVSRRQFKCLIRSGFSVHGDRAHFDIYAQTRAEFDSAVQEALRHRIVISVKE